MAIINDGKTCGICGSEDIAPDFWEPSEFAKDCAECEAHGTQAPGSDDWHWFGNALVSHVRNLEADAEPDLFNNQ